MTWWFYDIEVENWDRLVIACAYSDDGRSLVLDDGIGAAPKSDQCRDWFLSLPADDIVWSHGGGAFDFLQLIDCCPTSLHWSTSMAGSTLIRCRPKGLAECRDSSRLFPGSLADWTDRKSETGLACKCGEQCGGYCAIRRDLPDVERKRLIAYCMNDCEIGLQTLKADLARLEGEGLAVLNPKDGLPRLTFGSVAWGTASAPFMVREVRKVRGEWREVDVPQPAIEWDEYDAGRCGYYGGNCQVGRAWWDGPVYPFDVHAMYPWALTLPVPHGRWRAVSGWEVYRHFDAQVPGNYHASIEVPDTDLPPLPHRYSEPRSKGRLHRDRLLWCTGRFEGWYTDLELREASEMGATIRSIDAAYLWSDFSPLYEPYVRMIYDARDRARAAGDKRWAGVLKWYANALSGKLAMRPDMSTTVVTEDPPDGWRHVGGRVHAFDYRRLSACSRPIQAAYLTSRARVKLLTRLYRHRGRWLYCDTDSTYLMDYDPTDVHESELGQWGYEGEASQWKALAPKLYRYWCGGCKEHPTGGAHVRARGIPKPKWETLDELAAGKPVSRTRGVLKLKASGGAFVKREIVRQHRDWNNDRCGTRFVTADGTTRPLHRDRYGDYS